MAGKDASEERPLPTAATAATGMVRRRRTRRVLKWGGLVLAAHRGGMTMTDELNGKTPKEPEDALGMGLHGLESDVARLRYLHFVKARVEKRLDRWFSNQIRDPKEVMSDEELLPDERLKRLRDNYEAAALAIAVFSGMTVEEYQRVGSAVTWLRAKNDLANEEPDTHGDDEPMLGD